MRRTTALRLFASAATAVFGIAMAAPALAQTAPAVDEVEEVVVTAQKREQNLQDVPAAVSAFGAQQLEAQSTQNLTDLSSKVPNVVLAPVGAYPYASAFFIRGLGWRTLKAPSSRRSASR